MKNCGCDMCCDTDLGIVIFSFINSKKYIEHLQYTSCASECGRQSTPGAFMLAEKIYSILFCPFFEPGSHLIAPSGLGPQP